MTIDKIKHYVPKQIIETINQCVALQEKAILEKWLADCKHEISRREESKESAFPLHYEKAYLEIVLH